MKLEAEAKKVQSTDSTTKPKESNENHEKFELFICDGMEIENEESEDDIPESSLEI